MPIAIGTVFGPYKILEQIGVGGMGEVYRSLDTRLEREVAIKLVSDTFLASELGSASPSPAGTPHSRAHLSHERFLREARSAATLNHPNICAIHDVGEQDGRPYLVMELLRGATLKAYMAGRALAPAEVLLFAQQAASALAAAHAKGIVHRDIKPANLFVIDGDRKRKQLKILDFGLAKKQGLEASPDSRLSSVNGETVGASATEALQFTSPGSTVGTVAYMSPEQAKGDPLDARTDLFSFGSVIYEMATATSPFPGRSTAEVFAALLMKDPAPVSSLNPDMPPGLDAIVTKLLAKDKEQRYASAEDFLSDLEQLSQAERPSSSSDTAAQQAQSLPGSTSSHPVAATPSVTTGDGNDRRRTTRQRLIVIVALIALGGGGFKALHKYLPGSTPATVPASTGAGTGTNNSIPGAPATLKDSIIVADFVNKTGDAVFDTTLNQALRVQLGQSPVLDIVSAQHLRQSLQYLGRKEDEIITPQIAREIGEREGVKAILTGTISPIGKAYLITLTAQNTATGDDIASEDATAPDKDHVLDALNKTATGMRAKLGESLSSIRKLNAPFGQATTPSLEAFRAYALGDEAHQKGNDIPEAMDHYKRALELDPKLAMAWARIGVLYLNSGQISKANEYFTRAYQMSGNVSEREKLYVAGHYYSTVVGDLNKSIETLQVATQEYPLQIDNFINLGVYYLTNGDVEKSFAANEKALALQPDDAIGIENAIAGATTLDQLSVAQHYVEEGRRLKLDGTSILLIEMLYHGQSGNWDEVQKIVAQTAGRPDQFSVTGALASLQFQRGQFLQARDSNLRAADQASTANAKDSQAASIIFAANVGWPVGQCVSAEDAYKSALKLDKGKATESAASQTLAFCSQEKQALKAIAALEKKYPQDTIIQEVVVPQSRAFIALRGGDAHRAIELLERARAHDNVSFAPYLRGLAYLQLKDAQNAITSFQDATRRKGVAYYSGTPYALAQLGLGRAYALAGDKASAKKAYDSFFTDWKSADPNLSVMSEAKKEYAQL